MAYNVKFAFGSQASYTNLESKDQGTIYFITDSPAIYRGSVKMTCADDFAAYCASTGLGGKMATFLGDYVNGNKNLATVLSELDSHILDEIDITVAAGGNNKVLTGFEIEDGKLKAGSVTTITLADVATSGAAADVSIVDAGGLYDAATVEAALAEAMGKINANAEDAVVTVSKTTGGSGDDYVYRYTFSQGGTPITNGTIDIMKDMVATSGELVHPTPEHPIIIDGQQVTSGTYIKMTIASGDPFYIDVVDLIEYNSFTDSAEIDFTDNNHVISASIVDINGSKITYKNAIGEDPRESVNGALDRLQGEIDAIDDEVDQKIATEIGKLDATVNVPDHKIITSITEADGVITGTTSEVLDAQYVSYTPAGDGAVATTVQAGIRGVAADLVTEAATARAAEKDAQDAADAAQADVDALETYVGTIPAGAQAASVVAYVDEKVANVVADLDADVDAAMPAQHASDPNAVAVVTGVTEVSGVLTSVDSAAADKAGAAATAEANAKAYALDLVQALDADVDASGTPAQSGTMVIRGITEADGVITAVDSVEVEAAGAAAAARSAAQTYADGLIAALDADLDAVGTAAHSGTFVMSGVTEVNGVITAVDSVEVENAGAAAAAETAAKAYTDTALTWVELGA